jgi:hypothetical protein
MVASCLGPNSTWRRDTLCVGHTRSLDRLCLPFPAYSYTPWWEQRAADPPIMFMGKGCLSIFIGLFWSSNLIHHCFFFWGNWYAIVQWAFVSADWTPCIHWYGAKGNCCTCTTSSSWALRVMAARDLAVDWYAFPAAVDQIFCRTCWHKSHTFHQVFLSWPMDTRQLCPLREANFIFIRIRRVVLHLHHLVFALRCLELALMRRFLLR